MAYKILSSLIFLCLASGLKAQEDTVFIRYNIDETGNKLNYKTDTLLLESSMNRNVLVGTTILPATHGQINALGYWIGLEKVTKSNCQRDVTEYSGKGLNDHIVLISKTDSTIMIDFNLYDNCCYEFLCDLEVDESGVLNLIYHGYGMYCGCDCCFGLTYHLSCKPDEENAIKVKAVMLNGDKKTLTQL